MVAMRFVAVLATAMGLSALTPPTSVDAPGFHDSGLTTAAKHTVRVAALPTGRGVASDVPDQLPRASVASSGADSVPGAIAGWVEAAARDFQALVVDKLAAEPARLRLAQAGKTPVQKPAAGKSGADGDVLAPVSDWVERSARDFQGIVIKRLSVPTAGPAGTGEARPAAGEAARGADAPAPSGSAGGIVGQVNSALEKAQGWLNDTRRDFQKDVVKKLEQPTGTTTADSGKAASPPTAPPKAPDAGGSVKDKAMDAAAMRAAEEAANKKLKALGADDATVRKEAEAQAAAAIKAEEKRLADEAQRKAREADSARKAEDKRLADAAAARKKKEAEEAARKAQEKQRAEAAAAAARMADEASRKADEILKSGGGVPITERQGTASSRSAPTVAVAGAAPRHDSRHRSNKRHASRPRTCRHAGRRIKPPAVYVVARGDTLWDISRRHYRRGIRYKAIYRANDDKIRDPDLIFPCQRFFVPKWR